jgi:flavin-dependent thymidylate synthase
MTKEVQKWADEAMFTAEPTRTTTPEVYMLQGTPDPLGSIAAFSAMYTGKVVRDKRDVTDEERRYHLAEMQATKLKAPLEAVNIHLMVEGVTRAFTHQMVRQRTAVYAQESLRFAVKEDAAEAVAVPPSLAGTMSLFEWAEENGCDIDLHPEITPQFKFESDKQKMRLLWDYANRDVADTYNHLVNMGMPAEDARGLLVHNTTTRLNYATNLRNLQDHSGNRLCTQAQFEWRMFWVKLTGAMRNYCTYQTRVSEEGLQHIHYDGRGGCDNWQWKEIANLFRPVCYFTGKCEFKAKFDRHCNIRERVDANAQIGRPSTEWLQQYEAPTMHECDHDPYEDVHDGVSRNDDGVVFIGGINPAEWLMDDGAARRQS